MTVNPFITHTCFFYCPLFYFVKKLSILNLIYLCFNQTILLRRLFLYNFEATRGKSHPSVSVLKSSDSWTPGEKPGEKGEVCKFLADTQIISREAPDIHLAKF